MAVRGVDGQDANIANLIANGQIRASQERTEESEADDRRKHAEEKITLRRQQLKKNSEGVAQVHQEIDRHDAQTEGQFRQFMDGAGGSDIQRGATAWHGNQGMQARLTDAQKRLFREAMAQNPRQTARAGEGLNRLMNLPGAAQAIPDSEAAGTLQGAMVDNPAVESGAEEVIGSRFMRSPRADRRAKANTLRWGLNQANRGGQRGTRAGLGMMGSLADAKVPGFAQRDASNMMMRVTAQDPNNTPPMHRLDSFVQHPAVRRLPSFSRGTGVSVLAKSDGDARVQEGLQTLASNRGFRGQKERTQAQAFRAIGLVGRHQTAAFSQKVGQAFALQGRRLDEVQTGRLLGRMAEQARTQGAETIDPRALRTQVRAESRPGTPSLLEQEGYDVEGAKVSRQRVLGKVNRWLQQRGNNLKRTEERVRGAKYLEQLGEMAEIDDLPPVLTSKGLARLRQEAARQRSARRQQLAADGHTPEPRQRSALGKRLDPAVPQRDSLLRSETSEGEEPEGAARQLPGGKPEADEVEAPLTGRARMRLRHRLATRQSRQQGSGDDADGMVDPSVAGGVSVPDDGDESASLSSERAVSPARQRLRERMARRRSQGEGANAGESGGAVRGDGGKQATQPRSRSPGADLGSVERPAEGFDEAAAGGGAADGASPSGVESQPTSARDRLRRARLRGGSPSGVSPAQGKSGATPGAHPVLVRLGLANIDHESLPADLRPLYQGIVDSGEVLDVSELPEDLQEEIVRKTDATRQRTAKLRTLLRQRSRELRTRRMPMSKRRSAEALERQRGSKQPRYFNPNAGRSGAVEPFSQTGTGGGRPSPLPATPAQGLAARRAAPGFRQGDAGGGGARVGGASDIRGYVASAMAQVGSKPITADTVGSIVQSVVSQVTRQVSHRVAQEITRQLSQAPSNQMSGGEATEVFSDPNEATRRTQSRQAGERARATTLGKTDGWGIPRSFEADLGGRSNVASLDRADAGGEPASVDAANGSADVVHETYTGRMLVKDPAAVRSAETLFAGSTEWRSLTRAEKALLRNLGWTQQTYDTKTAPSARWPIAMMTPFAALSATQRESVRKLGFSPHTWDEKVQAFTMGQNA